MKKMKAFVFVEPGAIRLREVQRPEPGIGMPQSR